MISTGTASGLVPSKTVQAVAFMPGFSSEDLRISTLPALGRCISAALRVDRAAERKRAKLNFILENTCSHASSGYKKAFLHYDCFIGRPGRGNRSTFVTYPDGL